MSLEINKIYNEDCLAGMKGIPDKSIDLILQDPPYNTTDCKWEWDIMEKIGEFWSEWKRIIKDNGNIVMTATQPFTSKLIMSDLKMFKYDWIWCKNMGSNHLNVKIQPMRQHEHVVVFYCGKAKYFPILEERTLSGLKRTRSSPRKIGYANDGIYNCKKENVITKDYNEMRTPQSVQYFAVERGFHPTQKPIQLFEYLIKTYTNEGDIVFDGFMGSGTTAIACMNTNRKYVGFELDKKYFDIANKRIEEHVKQQEFKFE